MSKQREAMEMALKVIDDINTKYAIGGYIITLSKAKSMLLEALAESERKHNCLLNNMPDGTCAVCGNVVSSKNP